MKLPNKITRQLGLLCAAWVLCGCLQAQDLDRLERVLDRAKNTTERLDALKMLIDSSMTQDLPRAATYVTQLQDMAQRAGSGYHLGFAHEKQGTLSYRGSKLDSARVQYKRAYDHYWRAGHREEAWLAYTRIGIMYSLEGRFNDAVRIYDNVKARAAGNMTEVYAYLYNQLGTLYHYQAQADSAEHYYARSVQQYRATQDTVGMLRPMYNHAVLLVDNNKANEAKLLLYELKVLQEQLALDATLTYGLLGGISMSEGDYENARMYAEKQYDYAKATKDTMKMMIALGNLGELVLGSGEPLASIPYLEASLAISKKGGMWEEQQITLQNLGRAYLAMKNYDRAEAYFKASLDLSGSQQESRYAPAAMGYMGQVCYHTGRLEEGKQWVQKALANREGNLSNTDVAMIYGTLANIHLADQQPRLAIAIAEKGHSLLEESGGGYISWAVELTHTLYQAHKNVGDYQAALQYHEQYKQLTDTLFNVEKVKTEAKQLKDFEFELEKETIATQQKAREDLLQAKARHNALIAGGGALLTLVSLAFFVNLRRQQARIRTQNEELTRLNATKDHIFAIIGHDIRKPAIAFRGITQKINYLLQRQDYPRLTTLGSELEETAYTLTSITDNLLNWALLQKDIVGYRPQPVVLHQVAEELNAIFATAAHNKNITLRILDGTPLQQQVFADPLALRTILRNLIDNAIKYTPDGGTVGVTATTDEAWIHIGVQDTGIGIPEAAQKDLFLIRNNKSRPGTAGEQGTGLGLHLAYELAKINKGRLALNTKIAVGTRFELQLPLSV